MTELSETQTLILSTACAREDSLVFPTPSHLKGGPVGNCLKSLLKRGLVEEIKASDLNTVWRHDEHLGPVTLKATPLANSALKIDGGQAAISTEAALRQPVSRRKSTKQAQLIDLLKRPEGATISEIVTALDWQSHSVRGAMSGVRKKRLGLTITSEKAKQRGRVYRIVY